MNSFRQRKQPAATTARDDCASLAETACLLRSPANARRLRHAVTQLHAGKGTERKLPKFP